MSGPSAKAATARLVALANPAAAASSQRFFKTAAGEYGAGDLFRGIRVPPLRALAREFAALPVTEVLVLLRSPFHEDRLLALFLLNQHFALGSPAARAAIYTLYLDNTRSINNWDLVDASAEQIVGAWLCGRSRRPLRKLARSAHLWERRIAIIATFHFIRRNDFEDTLAIAQILLDDREDLIHKAVGWMLREVGKRDTRTLERFLDVHVARMPRTMLRYAIERMTPAKRARYMRR